MNKIDARKIIENPDSTPDQKIEAARVIGENTEVIDQAHNMSHNQPESAIDKAAREHQESEAAKPSTQSKQKGRFKSKFIFAKPAPKVHKDVAMSMLQLLFERYRIDPVRMQEDDLEYAESIETAATVVLDAIMLEEVKIYIDHADSNKLKVEQFIKLKSKEGTVNSIIYSEIEGNDNSAMPDDKGNNNHDKMYALLGSMAESDLGEHIVRQLRSSDMKTAHSLANLFLVP